MCAGDDMLMMSDDGWATAQEANNQGLWLSSSGNDQSVQAIVSGGDQFEDPNLSGWVQGFSDNIIQAGGS
jgi:transcription factor MYB, plant